MRIAFAILALAKGAGVILYAGLWLALPNAGDARDLRDRFRFARLSTELSSIRRRAGKAWHRTGSRTVWPRPMDRRWLAIGLVVTGALVMLASFGAFSWLNLPRAIGLAALAVGAGTLLSLADHGERR